jgi:hypothetical protein
MLAAFRTLFSLPPVQSFSEGHAASYPLDTGRLLTVSKRPRDVGHLHIQYMLLKIVFTISAHSLYTLMFCSLDTGTALPLL